MDPRRPVRYKRHVAPSPAIPFQRHLAALAVLSALAAVGACQRERQGSPRAVAEASVKAMASGDVELTRALLPPPELLRERLDCPPGGNDIVSQLIDAAPLVAERVRLTREALAGTRAVLREFDPTGGRDIVVAPGELFRGCTVREPLHLNDAAVVVRLTRAGRSQDDRQTLRTIELDGRWYLLE